MRMTSNSVKLNYGQILSSQKVLHFLRACFKTCAFVSKLTNNFRVLEARLKSKKEKKNVRTLYELEAMPHREKLKKNVILTKQKNWAHLHEQNTALTLLIYVLFLCSVKMTKSTRQSTNPQFLHVKWSNYRLWEPF